LGLPFAGLLHTKRLNDSNRELPKKYIQKTFKAKNPSRKNELKMRKARAERSTVRYSIGF